MVHVDGEKTKKRIVARDMNTGRRITKEVDREYNIGEIITSET